MSREVDIRENWEGTNRIKEVVVAAAVMIMVAVVSAVTSVVSRALRMTECLVGSDQIGFRHSTRSFGWFQMMAKSEFFRQLEMNHPVHSVIA